MSAADISSIVTPALISVVGFIGRRILKAREADKAIRDRQHLENQAAQSATTTAIHGLDRRLVGVETKVDILMHK